MPFTSSFRLTICISHISGGSNHASHADRHPCAARPHRRLLGRLDLHTGANRRRGADKLFRPQMGAAVVAVLTGSALWHLVHAGRPGPTEYVLAAGALSAV